MKREMEGLAERLGQYLLAFCKWAAAAALLGAVCGVLGAGFHLAIDWATEFRMAHTWVIWALPAAGAVSLLLYKLCRVGLDVGTDLVVRSATTNEHVPMLLAPLIMAGTLLSHLFGASVGREGAALQLGGSIGHNFGERLRFDRDDVQVLTLCGMAGCFSALFGTPLTAAIFVLEVIQVGAMGYNALLPSIVSSYTAATMARAMGAVPMAYALQNGTPAFRPVLALRVAALAALCALVGIFFCTCIHKAGRLAARLLPNPYLRIGAGGLLVAVLVPVFGLYDYAGAGGHMIYQAVTGGSASPLAFLLKLAFTALCVGVGFRGGEIVPTLFIGATFGCVAGPWLGLEPGFAAAVGLVALFCSAVNCPIASIFLAAELFAPGDLSLFGIAVAVAYVLSGYFGLYSSQEFVFSKIKREILHKKAK